MGQFATPPNLARQIAQSALAYFPEDEPISFLEPALGTGSFYEALLESTGGEVSSALGVEIDGRFAKAAKALWSDTPINVVEADFATLEPSKFSFKANLLITNPPYVRHHHIPADHKQLLAQLAGRISGIQPSGLAGLYVHFLLIAHRWLMPGAISAWLVPSEFMDVNYGDSVKQYLTERVELLRIHRFMPEDVQFDDALVTSTVLIFRNQPPTTETRVRYTVGGSMDSPLKSSELPVSELGQTRKWSNCPDLNSGSEYMEPELALGEAFTIRRGLATGDNSFFIRQLHEFTELGIPTEFLKPILPAPRHVRELVVEGGEDGYPLLPTKLALFDCHMPEEMLEWRHPAVFAFVQSGKALDVDKGYLCSGRKPWYSQEKREPPPVVCTYMGRPKEGQPPFRIIRNRSKAVATNVYLLLYPKPWLVKADFDGNLLNRVCDELRMLSSAAFTSEGRVYGGGLHKMEPKELARLPLKLDELSSKDRGVIQQALFERQMAAYGSPTL